jgi:hypothetical protein
MRWDCFGVADMQNIALITAILHAVVQQCMEEELQKTFYGRNSPGPGAPSARHRSNSDTDTCTSLVNLQATTKQRTALASRCAAISGRVRAAACHGNGKILSVTTQVLSTRESAPGWRLGTGTRFKYGGDDMPGAGQYQVCLSAGAA